MKSKLNSFAMGVDVQNLELESSKTPDDCMSVTSVEGDKSAEFASDHGEDDNHDDTEANIVDPYCIAEKPYRVTFQDVTSAAFLIKNGIECTPCTVCERLIFLRKIQCEHICRGLECVTKAWKFT